MNALLLILSFISTKLFGLDRTARAFTAVGRLRRRMHLAGPDRDSAAIAAGIERGLRYLPLPVECLDQALVTWYALNLKGHPAVMHIGMRLTPVSGHAWVTLGAETFVRTPGLEDFTVVAEYPAWATVSRAGAQSA